MKIIIEKTFEMPRIKWKVRSLHWGKSCFFIVEEEGQLYQCFDIETQKQQYSLYFEGNKKIQDYHIAGDFLVLQKWIKGKLDIYNSSGQVILETEKNLQYLSNPPRVSNFSPHIITWRQMDIGSNFPSIIYYEVNLKLLKSYSYELNKVAKDGAKLGFVRLRGFDDDNCIASFGKGRQPNRNSYIRVFNKFTQEEKLNIHLNSLDKSYKDVFGLHDFYFNNEQNIVFVFHNHIYCIDSSSGEVWWKIPNPGITHFNWIDHGKLNIHNNKHYQISRFLKDFVVIDLSTGKTFHRVKNWRANYAYLEEKHGLHLKDRYELHNSFFTMEADKILKDDKDCYLVDAYGNPRFIPYLYFLDNRNTELIHVMEFEETSAFRHEIHGDNLFVFTAGVRYEVMDMQVYRLSMGEKEPPILELLF